MNFGSDLAEVFRERALKEAVRYGTDSWVFVRELLQNARDAGADRIQIDVTKSQGRERITVKDNGDGMTFQDARRFLFTLYASGKRERDDQAGRFGVGFWSVLRFSPETIVIRSRPQVGAGWELQLDGRLKNSRWVKCDFAMGTEVVLERAARVNDLETRVFDSARRDGRFLMCRDDSSRRIRILVNNRTISEPFALPPPRVSFKRRGLRGVVSLGTEPKVELFAHGLRVRTVEVLEDLGQDYSGDSGCALLSDGVMPQFILDSAKLNLVLARGDARDDRRLRRIMRIARSQLHRLVEKQLDQGRSQSRWSALSRRLARPLRSAARAVTKRTFVLAVLVSAIVMGFFFVSGFRGLEWLVGRGGDRDAPVTTSLTPYSEIADRYEGPSVSSIEGTGRVVDLQYSPADRSQLFGGLRLGGLGHFQSGEARIPNPRLLVESGDSCVDIDLALDVRAGPLRLPAPTGHWIVGNGVVVEGIAIPATQSVYGDALIDIGMETRGRARYRTCPAEFADSTVQTTWPALPDSISAEVERVAPDSPEQGVSLGLAITQNAIAYDRSVEVATAYQQAREQGEPLFSCAERLGVGDCDVQNAILAAVLGEFGIPARMAVGYVGSGGHVLSGLHAWVEYLDSTGRWRIADASLRRARDVAAVAPESKGTIREVMTATEGLFGELPVVPAVGVVSVTLLISFALVVRLQRDRNTSMELGEIGRAQLLEGVLERPEAFNTIAALHSEPLVPVVRGKDISLKKVERLSRAGRLYCGRRGSLLVDKAVRRGLKVLDLDSDEARLVAEHFAAQDLERWQGFIDESAEVAPCRLLNSVLGQFGERWKTRVTSNGDQQIIVIAGAKLGVVRDLGSPLVLVSSDSELGRSVQEMAHSSPGAAALILAQALVPLQIKNTRIAGRVMAEIARMVLVEGSA